MQVDVVAAQPLNRAGFCSFGYEEKSLTNDVAIPPRVTGADANFYLHEVSEASMKGRGMSQEAAHTAAIEKYRVSPFSLYHPDVIKDNPSIFGTGFKKFWGLE